MTSGQQSVTRGASWTFDEPRKNARDKLNKHAEKTVQTSVEKMSENKTEN